MLGDVVRYLLDSIRAGVLSVGRCGGTTREIRILLVFAPETDEQFELPKELRKRPISEREALRILRAIKRHIVVERSYLEQRRENLHHLELVINFGQSVSDVGRLHGRIE